MGHLKAFADIQNYVRNRTLKILNCSYSCTALHPVGSNKSIKNYSKTHLGFSPGEQISTQNTSQNQQHLDFEHNEINKHFMFFYMLQEKSVFEVSCRIGV